VDGLRRLRARNVYDAQHRGRPQKRSVRFVKRRGNTRGAD
jgi:hypothetical protein